MHVLVLGGTGRIGAPLAKALAPSVSAIGIAARNRGLAEQHARGLGPKAYAVEADACNESQIAALGRDVDLIVNTAGPDYVTALPAARAAIAAGTHICDI